LKLQPRNQKRITHKESTLINWSIESLGGRQLQSDRGRLRVIGYLGDQSIAESVDYLTSSSSECLEDAARAEFRTSATGRSAA
jgi:hypothetical protein